MADQPISVDYGKQPEVSPQEAAHSKQLLKEINEVVESEEFKRYVEDIEKNRLYARGRQHEDDSGELVRANLIHSEIKALISTVYAKDPDISVTPTEAVSPKRYQQYRQFGKTLELVLANQFGPQNANLKAKAKTAIRASATSMIGWVKVAYQKDYQTDPQISARMRDIQDDIERMEMLRNEAMDEQPGTDGSDPEQRIEELKNMYAALEAEPEIVRQEGLVIDTVRPEDMIVSIEVQDSTAIVGAEKLTQRIWMTEERCKQRFGFIPSKGTRYAAHSSSTGTKLTTSERKIQKGQQLVCIYEQWNMLNNRVYTLCDGYEGYMRKPYTPKKVGERFHGFFPLIMDPVDGTVYPLCLVTNLRELQDEHNETRTNFRHHRKHSVPMWIGIEGKVTPKDANKIRNAESMEVVLIEGDESMPIEHYIHQFQNPTIDPNVYMTDHIREDWEKVTRRGDAARGSVAKAKTATEANILQQGLNVDSNEAQDTVEEWLRDIAQYSAEVLLQEMTPQQVMRIAGEQAVWPAMTKDIIFDMVALEIRAGSSGKPDKRQEQEQWLMFLPELRDTLMQVQELKAAGQDEASKILMRLVEETFRRFDEKIDIEEFIPRKNEMEEAEEDAQRQQQQQKQQEAERLMMQEQRAKIKELLTRAMKNIADAEATEVGQQIQEYMADLEAIERAYAVPTLPGPTDPAAMQPPQPPQVVQ